MNLIFESSEGISLLVAAGFGLAFSAVIYPIYIRWLKEKQIEQFIREEGPQSHAAKAKTPTMGGIGFILSTIFMSAIVILNSDLLKPSNLAEVDALAARNNEIAAGLSLVVALACGALGLADDYGKVTSRSNRGLSARFRLIAEMIFGFIFAACIFFLKLPFNVLHLGVDITADNLVPLNYTLPDSIMIVYAIVLIPFLVAATTNAVNLHDGMDGLAGGTSMIVFATLAMLLFITGNAPLAWVAATCSGSLLGFLIYNRYPAKVFMGDTGSLFLGGLMAALVVAGGLTVWFVPLSLIYIVESISVMAQVAYFKLTKPYTPEKPMSSLKLALYKLTHRLPGDGKRLLRMAPIHHHFEAIAAEKGKKEWTVVVWFWLIQIGIASLVCLGFRRW